MKPYANNYALTDSILQEGQDLAKAQLFGRGEDNVQYTKGVAVELRALEHHVEVLFSDRKEILQAVGAVVLHKEIARLK